MKIILGLVGQIASGKGSVSDYLRKKYKASFYHFSTPLRKTLTIWGLEENRENLVKLSKSLRNTFGQEIIAKTISNDIKKDKSKIIVVDCVRRMADIKYLKNLPEFELLFIKTNDKIRYKRLIERTENKDDKTKTYKQFLQDAKLETEKKIAQIGKKAKLVINNNGSLKELHSQIDKIVHKV